jgi:adenylate kinase
MLEESTEPGISFDAFCKLLQPLNNLDFDSIMKYWLKQVTSVEIPDAEIIFNTVYRKLLDQKKASMEQKEIGNEEFLLRFPYEILYLGGAPGAGKGTVTEHILKIREISAPPIVMSSLLDSPQARKIKEAGGLVGDFEVVEMLFTELLKPVYQNGVVVDGFPRTLVQVEVVKRLYDKMMRQHKLSSKSGRGEHYFRRPVFRSIMLFVDEKESVNRQLRRGQQVIEHNKKVQETGTGTLIPLRKTDIDRDAARLRYNIFKEQTYDSLQKLKQYFHFHMIDAQGTIEEVKHNIEKELLYQSSLELSADTFATIKHIPTASDVIINARQKLVARLDDYQRLHTELFQQVAKVIEEEFEEKLMIGAVAGCCYVSSTNPIFDNELARKMVLDIMSDRGFTTTCRSLYHTTPIKIQSDGSIICQRQNIYEFNVRFQRAVTMTHWST